MSDAKRIAIARARIQSERKRQIEVEGYDEAHDDAHDNGELLRAAVLYFLNAKRAADEPPLTLDANGAPLGWPWEAKFWKPDGGVRDLERAGALAMAERDRLRRLHRPIVHVDQKLQLMFAALANHPRLGVTA